MDTEVLERPANRGKVGAPTKFDVKYLAQVKALAYLGATDRDLAEAFEVSIATIWHWQKEPRFLSALKLGKDEADSRVERSLYQRAIGYTFPSEKVFCLKDGDIIRVATEEHVAPSVTACIFWLKNRRREQWRDVHKFEHEHNHRGEVKVIAETMSAREAAEQYALTLRDVTPQAMEPSPAGSDS